MSLPVHTPRLPELVEEALDTAARLRDQYNLSALDDLLESCREFSRQENLNIAVLGRFKAGKSSFLNHILRRDLLPVGVIPVTSIVTEVQYGPAERAEVQYLNGEKEEIPLSRIQDFVAENRNPENQKRAAIVRVELPSMEHYRGIRFVDTPGLESVLEHNTDALIDWLPNVGLALVAVGVDPPLSKHDISLIRNLSRYTPNITLLLTKVDTLSETERGQVIEFVRQQLARYWEDSIPLFPYSTRPGFEDLRNQFEITLLGKIGATLGQQREAILRHKLDSLLGECVDYLTMALRAAERADNERAGLKERILGRQETLDDARLALKLIVRHQMGTIRSEFEALLGREQDAIRKRMLESFACNFPGWTRSLRSALENFEEWGEAALRDEMGRLSVRYRSEFLAPAKTVSRRLSQSLQDFRNRISERALQTLGAPLRTTEVELRVEEPAVPDVRIGKVFDHNWELLSWLIPMGLVENMIRRHFERKTDDLVFINLSRLASQWEELVNGALVRLEKEALRRLDGLIATIEKLIDSAGEEAARLREEIENIEALRTRLRDEAAA